MNVKTKAIKNNFILRVPNPSDNWYDFQNFNADLDLMIYFYVLQPFLTLYILIRQYLS